ncbi:hypothetical protein [Thermoplasma volcanium GSS1]|uniref:PPM-type phosphatase domain-containing protein n=1 Tax=Thermoplasma volcanium (strain ATCC 51530 / DSM 4299 / JCM 9571 / NBRC 15438 / GSS1) TaxID=273116 RepID=Q97AV7_THEVO|nr:PP2C family serine/threonine-protein phosphatase [Thermoplasma volcanium]BAB59844.1 hypothetical protein [Thermoplasma volcanium GSS1]
MEMIKVEYFSDSSAVPHLHLENEDSYSVTDDLFIVADGVGSYEGSKDASRYAVNYLSKMAKEIQSKEQLVEEIIKLSEEIKSIGIISGRPLMSTTISVLKISTEKYITANVGDSPIVLLRSGKLYKLYIDDSERSSTGNRFALEQAFGWNHVIVHSFEGKLEKGDLFIICTDGVSDNLSDEYDLYSILRELDAQTIVRLALNKGIKPDDATIIKVYVTMA